jgi:peptidoglycan L-alanyl-D-glutamate endopeptidase CwlK
MLIGVVIYFLVATALLACWLLPPVRDWALGAVQGAWRRGQASARHCSAAGGLVVQGFGAGAQRQAHAARSGLQRHGRWLAAAFALLVLAPALALALRSWHRFDGFDHTASRAVDERVAALLHGEQLVPPPALPPELFTVQEVAALRPMLGTASRQWELLDADFRQRLLMVFKQLKDEHGYDAVLLEGFRSAQRQAALAALGPTVTQAGAFESYHQFGLAADVAFLREGRIVISERDPWAMRGYELYGQAAEALGLHWGGRWRGLRDFGHVELRRPGVLRPGTAAAAAHTH